MAPSSTDLVWLRHVLLWGIGCAILWLSWTGFVSSDDEYYVSSGLGWLHDFPFVAKSFGEIRAGVAIPIAVSFGLLGESEFAAVLSASLFYLATLSVSLHMLSRVISYRAAFTGASTLATLPLIAISATIPIAELPELFFVAVSFFLFWMACQQEQRFWLLILAGISAALAFSTHEVSVALLLFYGLLFAIGFGVPRAQYWVMAIGFVSVVGIECLYYFAMTGDPLYRFTLLTKGAGLRDRVDVGFMEFTPSGTLHVWEPLDPLIMLVTHQHQFSILIFVAIPALWWAFARSPTPRGPAHKLAFLLAALGIVWLIFAALALTNQRLLPRYYTVAAYCFFMTTAIWAAVEIWPRHPWWVKGGIITFVLVSLLGIHFANTNPRFAERELVRYLAKTTEPVHTDPLTADKSQMYCRWEHLDCSRIKETPPSPGSVYYYNPKNADRANRLLDIDRLPLYQPGPNWTEIWRQEESRKGLANAVVSLGAAKWMPQSIYQKFDRPNRMVSVFRVPK